MEEVVLSWSLEAETQIAGVLEAGASDQNFGCMERSSGLDAFDVLTLLERIVVQDAVDRVELDWFVRCGFLSD